MDEDLLKLVDKNEALDIFDSLALEREVLGIYLSNHPARFFMKDAGSLGTASIRDILDEFEEGRRFYGQRGVDIWVAGIITTEIKPVKSRDGKDYYLKGILESNDGSVEFSINRIENPLGNPDVAKLASKVPLFFKVKPRAVINKEDESLEKVVFSIDNLKNDVLTVDRFILYSKSQNNGFEPVLVYECTGDELRKNKENLQKIISSQSVSAMSMKMQLRINFDNAGDSVVLEQKASVDISELAKYKALLGYDKIYLKGNG